MKKRGKEKSTSQFFTLGWLSPPPPLFVLTAITSFGATLRGDGFQHSNSKTLSKWTKISQPKKTADSFMGQLQLLSNIKEKYSCQLLMCLVQFAFCWWWWRKVCSVSLCSLPSRGSGKKLFLGK